MPADGLTKALAAPAHKTALELMGLRDVNAMDADQEYANQPFSACGGRVGLSTSSG